ncbi:hypothetical protein M8818_005343 [Zalaria obscura]|uniref:Uncharacterized protein n=1 Tax=Zalaria obscura TaxID=2024903 RepID=A0ACC3S9Y5_9PEZI
MRAGKVLPGQQQPGKQTVADNQSVLKRHVLASVLREFKNAPPASSDTPTLRFPTSSSRGIYITCYVLDGAVTGLARGAQLAPSAILCRACPPPHLLRHSNLHHLCPQHLPDTRGASRAPNRLSHALLLQRELVRNALELDDHQHSRPYQRRLLRPQRRGALFPSYTGRGPYPAEPATVDHLDDRVHGHFVLYSREEISCALRGAAVVQAVYRRRRLHGYRTKLIRKMQSIAFGRRGAGPSRCAQTGHHSRVHERAFGAGNAHGVDGRGGEAAAGAGCFTWQLEQFAAQVRTKTSAQGAELI